MLTFLTIFCFFQIMTRSFGFELQDENSITRNERALLFPKASTLGVSFPSANCNTLNKLRRS